MAPDYTRAERAPTTQELRQKLGAAIEAFDEAAKTPVKSGPRERAVVLVVKQLANEVAGRAHALAEALERGS